MYDNVNQTVVDRFNSIAHQAYSLEDFEFLFDSTANLEALDNSADLHSLSSSLSYAEPDDYWYESTDYDCTNAIYDDYDSKLDQVNVTGSNVTEDSLWAETMVMLEDCYHFDQVAFENDMDRWQWMRDTLNHVLNETDYVYEAKFSVNHITNWTIVENFDVAFEEAVERRSVNMLEAIFNGTQEFALAPSNVTAAFKEAVIDFVPDASDDFYVMWNTDSDCEDRLW